MHVGMEVTRRKDSPAKLTQVKAPKSLEIVPTSRQRPLPPDEIMLRQCELGELCLLATVSGPNFCAGLARLSSRVRSLQGSDIYRIDDLV